MANFSRLASVSIFIVMTVALIYVIATTGRSAGRGVALPAADSTSGQQRAVRLGQPVRLDGGASYFVPVYYGNAFSETTSSYSDNAYYFQPIVNAMFVSDGSVRLLLDEPAYIVKLIAPDSATGTASQSWLGYHVALTDTNGDGQLNGDDGVTLATSDLAGTGWRIVLPDGLYVDRTEVLDADRLLVTAFSEPPLKRGRPDTRRQQVFIYHGASAQLVPFEEANRALNRAGVLLGR